MKQLIFLLVFAALIVACSETKVVQIDSNQPAEASEQPAETQSESASTGTAVETAGKIPVTCDDMDLDDQNELGVVEVTYSDGTSEKFYDFCPGKEFGNDMIITEYICDGNQPKTKNYICSKSECMMFPVKSDPGRQVGACI
ncbi:hypothetical protein JXB27_03150 [Candidatus Woesearchaeota archaeon]|nr:hypothetical protein [Candidatus Woesearchaeota archaeon]